MRLGALSGPSNTQAGSSLDLSVVIPVFNSSATISLVVARVLSVLADCNFEIVLVDDGSMDDSAHVCQQLVRSGEGRVNFIRLARNFGEHNAVMAGFARTSGHFVAVLDDDGQNPPEELPRMLAEIKRQGVDVLYGRYADRQHAWWRRAGSAFNDRVACVMLGKPKQLYLSSFKILTRFVVDQILRYEGPYPYIDGLICRTTGRLGEITVAHAPRQFGRSNYTLKRLLRLWLNMFLGFSILPLRLASIFGLAMSGLSLLWLLLILIDKLWITPSLTAGIPTVLACIVLFSGVQLVMLGTVGEYLGRLFLTVGRHPQYVVRDEVTFKRETPT